MTTITLEQASSIIKAALAEGRARNLKPLTVAVLDPGASPHPPHRHPEEEFLIISEGTGVIECEGKTTEVGPGAIMYCASNALHGITNTGKVPLTFYWSKWIARGF